MSKSLSLIDKLSAGSIEAKRFSVEAIDTESKRLTDAAVSDNTVKTYSNGVRQYLNEGFFFPAKTKDIIDFITILSLKELSASTARTYVSSVISYHESLGFNPPNRLEIRTKLKGFTRTSKAVEKKGAQLTQDEVLKIVIYLKSKNTPEIIRNRALFLTMLWTLCRTDEVARMSFEGTEILDNQVNLKIHGSKTHAGLINKEIPKLSGGDNEVLNAICPVDALNAYFEACPYKNDGLFKKMNRAGKFSDQGIKARSIRNIILNILTSAGIDEARAKSINGHSLRHTIATFANQINLSTLSIKNLGNWKSDSAVAVYAGSHTINSINEIASWLSKDTHNKRG
ncbi:tyrosine-type recombinase/integrase [Pseudoalteromonas marina]|uniref:Tyrosine-type recombinase/integrase n=1 Tax=Pseudoalteromonas marina TaxID=267375 RepID=A0ABT9FID6_9GAMM|nr:tyrosine-type recombinase/integrase [Pseudoalteromonas marina]MDP2566444.1 tyrosine-type recombinase/integrase [Pseudoalteromonas marina]